MGKKALIGACGGFCLSLIKLMDAGFYLDEQSIIALQGYLFCLAYICMSMIGALFMDEKNAQKLLRQSLLIPSVFLAIVQGGETDQNQEFQKENSTPQTEEIQSLGDAPGSILHNLTSFLIPSAMAQPPVAGDTLPRPNIIIDIISRSDLEPGIYEGAKYIWGRRTEPPKSFMFVVGKASSPARAAEIAGRIDSLPGLGNHIISFAKFEGGSDIYLKFGGMMAEKEARELEYEIKDSIYAMDTENVGSRAIAELVLKGRVMDASEAFKKKY